MSDYLSNYEIFRAAGPRPVFVFLFVFAVVVLVLSKA